MARSLSVGAAVRRVADRATAVTRLEVELATLELRKKAAKLGIGIGLGLAAALLGLLMFGFLLATITAALATFLATWLALLIMTAALGCGAALLGVIALGLIKRGTPPVPEQAIREAQLTKERLQR
ncbi:MAG TPA: phage holin family protein [Gaiellaceae bacterium]